VIADALGGRGLTAELNRRGHAEQGSRREDIRLAIAAGGWRDIHHDDRSTSDRIDPRTFSKALDDILPAERLVAVDSGHFMGWPPMYLSVPDAAGFVFTQSFQSIGLGLSSAIGAAIARPDRLAVACLGDGGALMAAGEFETLVRLQLPMLVAVYNDAAYGAEVHHFGPQGHDTGLVRYPDLISQGPGDCAGAATVVARVPGALEKWLERREGPFVLDVKVVGRCGGVARGAFRAH
jgi:thiamine pyrophosphate-dependent acetolactate synthase large subunit-like protein